MYPCRTAEARGWLEHVPTNKKKMIPFLAKNNVTKETENCVEPSLYPLQIRKTGPETRLISNLCVTSKQIIKNDAHNLQLHLTQYF